MDWVGVQLAVNLEDLIQGAWDGRGEDVMSFRLVLSHVQYFHDVDCEVSLGRRGDVFCEVHVMGAMGDVPSDDQGLDRFVLW